MRIMYERGSGGVESRCRGFIQGRQFIIYQCCDKQAQAYKMNFFDQILYSKAYSETDIVKKCKKYPEWHKELEQIEVAYLHDLNMALYASLEEIETYKTFEILHKDILYVNFYAYRMDCEEEFAVKYYHVWIKMLDEQLRLNFGKKYCIIYYHCYSDSNYPFNFLKAIFKKLPIYYYAMLDKLYIVESTFYIKSTASLFEFGRLYKLFQRKLEHIEKLTKFVKMPEIQKNNIFQTWPDIFQEEVRQKNSKKAKQSKEIVRPVSIAINQQFTFAKKDCLTIELASHKLTKDGNPLVLAILFESLKSNPKFLDLTGIFRLSGAIDEEQQIIQKLSIMNNVQPLNQIEEYRGASMASVVKKFFTKLISPIVSYHLYNLLLKAIQNGIKPEQQISFVNDFLSQLAPLNRKTLLYLITFLKQHVISRQQINKMNSYNISVCFCPCIFRSESPSLADLMNTGNFAGILNLMFTHYEEIIGQQKERNSKGKSERGSSSAKSPEQKVSKTQSTTNNKAFRISTA